MLPNLSLIIIFSPNLTPSKGLVHAKLGGKSKCKGICKKNRLSKWYPRKFENFSVKPLDPAAKKDEDKNGKKEGEMKVIQK